MLNWLISSVGAGLLKGEISARLQRAGRHAALIALAGLLWLTAVGFALGAFVTWLSEQVGAVAACGIVAAGFAVLALIIQLTLRLSRGPRAQPQASPLFSGLPGSEELAGASPLGMVAVIAVLGYLLGRQTRPR
jgi:hypothetical protein